MGGILLDFARVGVICFTMAAFYLHDQHESNCANFVHHSTSQQDYSVAYGWHYRPPHAATGATIWRKLDGERNVEQRPDFAKYAKIAQ